MSPKMRCAPKHVCNSTEKKHFLTGKYPKLEKKHVRHAACPAAGDRAGRRLGRLYSISLSISKVRLLKGV